MTIFYVNIIMLTEVTDAWGYFIILDYSDNILGVL